jgi:hypothetical protein
MGDRQYRTFFKFIVNNSLNYLVVFQIDVGSCLINQDYFTLLQKGPTNAEKLLLAD